MKKILKYLFLFTIIFILPSFVFAEETDTTFDHIAIDKNISLEYQVSGSNKTYNKTLDSRLSGVKLYVLDKDNSEIKNEMTIDLNNVEEVNDTYLIKGNFNKYYNDGTTEVKYLVEYTFSDDDKIITYFKDYSFSSDNNKSSDRGILIKLQANDISDIKVSDNSNNMSNVDDTNSNSDDNLKNSSDDETTNSNSTRSGSETDNYVVVFTYGSNKYLMANNDSISLSRLLSELKVNINLNDIKSIDYPSDHFTMTSDGNNYELTSTTFVDNIETLVITTNDDQVYRITVKDANSPDHTKTLTDNGNGTYHWFYIHADVT